MRLKTTIFLVIALGLSVFYCAILLFALNPRVSEEYRAYYIERISGEWRPVRYAATLEDGITFSAPGLPVFVRHMSGFSFREGWGRWTDANRGATARIVLADGLTGSVCLDLKARPANSMKGKVIKVTFGEQQEEIIPQGSDYSDYFLEFFEARPAETLEFRFPGIVPPENTVDRSNSDTRRLGLAMVNLRLFRGKCAAFAPALRNANQEHAVPH
jgi:phosphoglycerol transferase